MDGIIKRTGENKVKRFLQTLTDQEKIELIEEVQRMVNLKTLDLNKTQKKEFSTEFSYYEDY